MSTDWSATAEATAGRALDTGDRLPGFALPDQNGTLINPLSDDLAGRPLLLVFETGSDEAGFTRLLMRLADGLGASACENALLLAVTRRELPEALQLHRERGLPCALLSDAAGKLYADCAIGGGRQHGAAVTLVADANLRLVRRLSSDDASRQAERAMQALAAATAGASPGPLGLHPPVLVLPRVLDEDDCAWLIEVWHRPVRIWDTDGFSSAGHDLEREDFKVRGAPPASMLQMVVRDPAVQRHLDERLYSRVVPEIRKAFQTGVSQREDYRIAAYEAAAGGNLPAHRDNPTPRTRHRRFTVSVSLNGDSYEGGGLRFPEYTTQAYQVPTGAGVVWSCTLLHEVLPVISGRRFILGTHLFGM